MVAIFHRCRYANTGVASPPHRQALPLMAETRSTWRRVVLLATLIAMLVCALPAWAGTKVWVNTNSGVYHCPGSQYYGQTRRGKFLDEGAAVRAGYRAAYGQACSPQEAQAARAAESPSPASSPAGASVTVWVNPASHVYHCPGTRYYGATKRGSYMSEGAALAAGNRPAYGAKCQ